MKVRFPLQDVVIHQVDTASTVKQPLYADGYWQMNQNEFSMNVEGVGSFYACKGEKIEFAAVTGVPRESVELYLNGSVYGAILHQRKILPLHGSCFSEKGVGVMICGESGAGKSSLTAAFCLSGSTFLTDDVTPVIIRDGKPYIRALSDRIKLWHHSLKALGMENEGLKRIDPGTDKFYYDIKSSRQSDHPLDIIIVLAVGEGKTAEIEELTGALKVSALRNEIYRWEYLQGMPENEAKYFTDLVNVGKHTVLYEVIRPASISLQDMAAYLRDNIIRQRDFRS